MANRPKFTPKRRERFLEMLRDQPNISRAARAVQMTRRGVYDWKEKHEDFAAEWDDAIQEGCDRLEEEAWRRAHDGVEEGIYYQGDKVDTVKRYSDHLLVRLLEAHKPEKYVRRLEATGKDGAPLSTVVILPPEDPIPE